MEMEQMMEHLVAAVEKMDANLQEMKAGQEHLKEEMSRVRTPERRNAGQDRCPS
jgi:hypothetical protein